MKITLHLELRRARAIESIGLWERTVNWPGVPRVGESVLLTKGGWNTEIKRVWWNAASDDEWPVAEMSETISDEERDELIAALVEAGWVRAWSGAA